MKSNGMIPVLVLISGILLLLFNYGLSQPLNFTLEKKNIISWEWNTTMDVHKGDVIRMTCTTTAATSSQLLIRRENDYLPRVVNNGTTVTYNFSKIICEDMDTYICEYKQGQNIMEKATKDLVIYDCPPRPCNETTKHHTIPIYAELGETKNVSLCVIVFPDISKAAYFNDTKVLGNTPPSDDNWTWTFERKEFNKFMINVTVRNITSHSETIVFRIFTQSSNTEKLLLNYTLDLRKPGPPGCPKNVTAERSSQDIQLSWAPGLEGGAKQSFQIYYRDKESDKWEPYDEPVTEISRNVSNLEQNTTYYFRVIALNKYSNESNSSPDQCNNTAVETTVHVAGAASSTTPLSSSPGPSNGRPQNSSERSSTQNVVPIFVAVGILGILIIIASIIGICVYLKLVRHSKRNSSIKNSNQQQEEDREAATPLAAPNQLPAGTVPDDAGRYKSPEGLTYITLDHKPNTGTSRPNQAKRQNQKVDYVSLDFKKTGKYVINDLKGTGQTSIRPARTHENCPQCSLK